MHPRLVALVILLLLTGAGVVSFFHLVLRCIFHPDDRAREMLLGLDGFSNAGMFNGSRWETVSSHTGREIERNTWWALLLGWVLNHLDAGHCAKANELEQPVMDLLKKHGYKTPE